MMFLLGFFCGIAFIGIVAQVVDKLAKQRAEKLAQDLANQYLGSLQSLANLQALTEQRVAEILSNPCDHPVVQWQHDVEGQGRCIVCNELITHEYNRWRVERGTDFDD